MFMMLKKILRYPRVTLKYPAKPMDTTNIAGKPQILKAVCNLCGECAARCPSSAVVVDKEQNDISIKLDQCIFCYLCAQVCPRRAVMITSDFELAEKNKSALQQNVSSNDGQPNGAEQSLDELGAQVLAKAQRLFGRSLQIREVDAGSCNGCDYEINALNNPFNDLERFGIHFVASPRHADMLLVTGCPTRNMERALLKTYEATPSPKLVVAVGACACSGGIFRDSYATKKGIDTILPVDLYIPGCPPRPQAILYGILKALDRVK